MGQKIYFDSREDLLSFLDYTQEFLNWGCRKFYMTCNSGAVLTMNTYNGNNDTDGYMPYVNLKNYIAPYIETNELKGGLIIDIKLICPHAYKDTIDVEGYYNNFYVNFYSSEHANYVNISYEDITSELIPKPYIAWAAYIYSFYKKWAVFYGIPEMPNIKITS